MMTDKNIYLLLLIILGSLLIALYIKKEFVDKEGLGNPFKFITDLFRKITKIFTDIGNIFISLIIAFTYISNIFDLLRCPMSLIFNFPRCIYYFILDLIFGTIYNIIWYFVFCFFYCPVVFIFHIMCIFFGEYYEVDDEYDENEYSDNPKKNKNSYFTFCKNLQMEDVIFSRQSFFNFVDNIVMLITGSHLLYRDNDDIRKCYCIAPIRVFFRPLEKYRSYSDTQSSEDLSSLYYVLLSIIVLVLLYFSQKK